MRLIQTGLGDLDDGEACDEGHERNEVERCVNVLAPSLPAKVISCDSLLEEGGLGKNEDGDRHGGRVAREEVNGVRGDLCPDAAAEHEDANFGDDDANSNESLSHDVGSPE